MTDTSTFLEPGPARRPLRRGSEQLNGSARNARGGAGYGPRCRIEIAVHAVIAQDEGLARPPRPAR